MRRHGWKVTLTIIMGVALALAGAIGIASAQVEVQHGIGFTKGCSSPTSVGSPYSCSFSVRNVIDEAEDTLTINSLGDTVHASGGDVVSPFGFNQLALDNGNPNPVGSNPATCTGPTITGTGTPANPWVGATSCTLPFGSRVNVHSFSFYTVQPGDFALPNHTLADDATLGWHDVCDDTAQTGDTNCNPGPPDQGAASQSIIVRNPSQTTTTVLPAATVDVGTSVHDSGTVSNASANPALAPPSGNVTIDWFTNGTCDGAPNASTLSPVALDGSGNFNATGFSFAPTTAGHFAFKAHYLGDNTYSPSDGPCEPLTVVDANISITPQNATNPLSLDHVLTAHLNVNDGSGLVNAPDGTTLTASIVTGSATFVGSPSCTTAGGTGSCDVTISSATPGANVIRACASPVVGGITLNRCTGDAHAGDGPDANKTFVGARITIVPNATNEVGQPHTFTVTLEENSGSGYAAAAGETVNVTLTPSNGAAPTPAGPFTLTTNASGQVQVTFTSAIAGKVTGHACSTVSIGGHPLTVCTDGTGDNSTDAVKTFVDANISITPQNATNPIGTNHVLTGHVNVNDGSGGGDVNAPSGTTINFSIVSGSATFVGSNSCTTIGTTGSCPVTITSAVPGSNTIKASTDVAVGGLTLHRETGDAHTGDSPNATKLFEGAKIGIVPNATNEVGQPHTFTVTVQEDTGSGFGAASGVSVTVTLTPSNGATPTPAGPFTLTADASGQVQVTFTSPTPGKVTGHACATLNLGGLVTVCTDGTNGNSVDAVKTFVDANIAITPQNATNPVGTNHVLTGHVNINDGSGSGYVNAPAGTTINFSIVSGPGSFIGPNSCTTIGATGSCTVTISSPSAGTTIVNASTAVLVGGVTLHRATGDGAHSDSGNATKLWADDVVTTRVRDEANNDITNQTVNVGTVVHDEATVAKAAGTPAAVPAPTGTVSFALFDNNACSGGNPIVTSNLRPLSGGIATSATFTASNPGSFSYLAHYNGDTNYPAHNGPCEPFTVAQQFTSNFTPGFWKTHQAATQALLPQTLGNHVVSTYAEAKTILSGMGCGSDGRLNCMAGMLLAAELNLAQGGNTCIQPVVNQANALLIKYGYHGFATYNLTSADSALAQTLHDELSAYNVDGIPTC